MNSEGFYSDIFASRRVELKGVEFNGKMFSFFRGCAVPNSRIALESVSDSISSEKIFGVIVLRVGGPNPHPLPQCVNLFELISAAGGKTRER